jgi:hypothetical protein
MLATTKRPAQVVTAQELHPTPLANGVNTQALKVLQDIVAQMDATLMKQSRQSHLTYVSLEIGYPIRATI